MMQEHVVAVPPSPPAPVTVLIPRKSLTVPLVTPGRLEAVTREIYSLLGVETDIIVVHDREYTVPSNHLAQARQAVRDQAAGPAPAPLQTVEVPIETINVPHYQPRITPTAADVYEALGVDVVDLVPHPDEQTVYTVLTAQAGCAKAALRHKRECPSAAAAETAAAAAECHHAALQAVPVPGLSLKDFYVGEPPHAIRILARLYGVRFLRAQNDVGVTYWIANGPAGVDATLNRLNLYV